MAFMDGGRVADEFGPSIRKAIRTDVLTTLAPGLVLTMAGLLAMRALPAPFVTTVLLLGGAALATVAVALRVGSQ